MANKDTEKVVTFVKKHFPNMRLPDPPDEKEIPLMKDTMVEGKDPNMTFGDFTGMGTNDAAVILQRANPKKGFLGQVVALIENNEQSYDIHVLTGKCSIAYSCLFTKPYSQMLKDHDRFLSVYIKDINESLRPPSDLSDRDVIYSGKYGSDATAHYYRDGTFIWVQV